MRVIVGLGNPGRAYAHTKHNLGFDVLDEFARRKKIRILGRSHRALVGRFDHFGEEILLVKPQTFMNESGQALGAIARKHSLSPDSFLVIYDDMDLPPGKIRIRPSGSSGGHRGMNSIIQHLHSQDFPRMRIGIGHQGEAIDHVLSQFNRKERQVMDEVIKQAADAVEMILQDGIDAAMNYYNRSEN